MRILIIEDNTLVSKALRHNLKSYYAIDIVSNGKDGLTAAQLTAYDTILLDLNLPDISGESICKSLRNSNIDTPIIVLSGRDKVVDKIELLNMGADDYITKPFNLAELHARINVAMRHSNSNAPAGVIIIEDLTLDPSSRLVTKAGIPITLRRKEFDLLELLMRNKGQTLPRTIILEHIWDMNENLWANVIDVHIKHLRDKIDRPFGTKFICTVHGIGYKLETSISHKAVKKII